MKIVELNLKDCFSTTIHNPSPHRFFADEIPVSDRTLPIEYCCELCGYIITLKTSDFEKHHKNNHSNLDQKDRSCFQVYISEKNLNILNFLDFYCPGCKQATSIYFSSGQSGYWGSLEYEIKRVLVAKSD